MSLKFEKYDANTYEAWDGPDLLAVMHIDRNKSVFMLLNYCSIENGEQIIAKMKELQGEEPGNQGIQIGNNNTQINNFS